MSYNKYLQPAENGKPEVSAVLSNVFLKMLLYFI